MAYANTNLAVGPTPHLRVLQEATGEYRNKKFAVVEGSLPTFSGIHHSYVRMELRKKSFNQV